MKRIVFSVISAVILCSMLVFCVGASSQKSVFVDFKQTYGFSVAQCESYSFNDNNGILSGTAAAKSETDMSSDPCIFFNTTYVVGEDSEFHVRMKHNTSAENTTLSVFFAGTKADGTAFSYSQSSRYDQSIAASSDGKYLTYIIPIDTSVFKGAKITNIRLDPISHAGTFDVDYFMLTEGEDQYVWNFQTDNNFEGWWCQNQSADVAVKDGAVVYTPAAEFESPYMWKNVGFEGDAVTGVEIILKHNVTSDATSTVTGFYFDGTDSSNESFDMSEGSCSKITLPLSSGEQSCYYYHELTDIHNWSGSTINNIRVDAIRTGGSFEIDRVRFLYDPNNYKPLDPSKMSLTYDFDTATAGDANGDIIIDFGGQEAINAKNIRYNWSSKKDGVYTDLAEYTALKASSGDKLNNGAYTISKGLLIPEGATAISAHITDDEKTFTLNYDIPQTKLPTYKTPEYTVAFASDFHFGWWGTENGQALPIHENVLSFVDEKADFMVVAGDSTTWNGASDKVYEWTGATNYFKRFTIPVFITQGNHELPTTYPLQEGYSDQYFKDFFNNWIKYSEDNGFYPEKIERVADDLYYYDAEVNGHHYIFMQIPFVENFSGFGEEQLKWLDNKLFEKEKSGKPIFIVGHYPMRDTVGNTASSYSKQISDHVAFKAILDKHPTAIYVSGHTHYSLYNEATSVVDGKLVAPSFINDGGIISQSTEQEDGTEITTYDNAQAVIAEVCDDRIVLKGRDFSTGKWISSGLYQITFTGSTKIEGLCATRRFDGTNTVLKASVSGDDTGVTYTWYADGVSVGTGKNLTIEGDSEAVIAVRAADATGYASEVAEVTTAPVVTAPVVLGAQLRVPQSADDKVAQGLRFVSKITPEVYSMLSEAGIIPDSAADTGLGFGTVVIPQSLIPTGQKLTKETANAYISPAVKLFDGNISSEVKYTVCVIDIPEKKYTTKYTVVPYITYMDGDKEVTVYGEEFTASVYQIAKVAVGSSSQESTFVKNYINKNIINYVDQNEGWTDGIYRP